jgi:urease accessory protein
MNSELALLHLLQLVSPALPVGAYSYSEGLEALVDRKTIANPESLQAWLENELRCGSIRLEAAVMLRTYWALASEDLAAVARWNAWQSAARETEELREQSWQMGRSLLKLLVELQPQLEPVALATASPCNYSVAFGIAAAFWKVDASVAVTGYLQSWIANLISAAVRLIPLGQTAGQQTLLALHNTILETTQKILAIDDEDLSSCSWGLALASMSHQTQYTRLFRS